MSRWTNAETQEVQVSTTVDTAQRASGASAWAGARAYFASDARRAIQTVLGLIWLIDGALQFQSFMYTRGFVHTIAGGAAGEPYWLLRSIRGVAHPPRGQLNALNTASA